MLIMENKFKKGDSVVLVSEVHWQEDGLEPMKVVGFTASGDIVIEIVEWNNQKVKQIYPPTDLMLESEAEQKLSKLDEEFQKLSPTVSAQMSKVSAAFEVALKLAND